MGPAPLTPPACNVPTACVQVAGVVGSPNVGKSSLINSLVRARAARTGNTPGVTRVAQTVHLDKHLTLLDSPGLVLGSQGADTAALHSFTRVPACVSVPGAPGCLVQGSCWSS